MGWTFLTIRSEAWTARAEVRSAKDLDGRDLLEGDAVDQLERYGDRFDRISDRLDSPLLTPVGWLPVAGRQLDAARHQMDAAAIGLRSAAGASGQLHELFADGMGAGPERIETLRAVEQTARETSQSIRSLDLGPGKALIGLLSNSRAELEETRTEAIETLERTAAASLGLAEFLDGPSDYLLLSANNSQMQNGQGMPLLGGVLHAEGGRMDLGPMQSLATTPAVDPPVALEADLADRWGWLDPNLDLRHLGLTARFPVTGSTATQLWAQLGNPAVGGVLVVDPYMLEAIMSATGPVSTEQGERTARDIVEYALHGQYQGYLTDGDDRSYTVERRDELEEIARSVLEDLDGLGDLDPALIDELSAAAGGRHLLMWSADPTVQAGFEAAGVDGQMSVDSLLLALVNRSGVKLDWFMDMSADLTLEPGDGDRLEAVLDISITNRAPRGGEPRYVVGPYPGSGLEPGEYLGLVTLTLPAGATNSRFDSVERLAVAGSDGQNRTVAAWVQVPRGATTHLVARFELPRSMSELVVEPSARARATTWSFESREWKDRGRRTLPL